MKDNTLRWLYAVPGRKKLYILVLMIVQALNGASGVLYALMLRNIVDSAVDHNRYTFYVNVLLTVLLVCGQLLLRAVIRWLTELSKSTRSFAKPAIAQRSPFLAPARTLTRLELA